MWAIEIKDLSFSYNSERQILKNISLQIPYHKLVCIVGHNGSGKSTLSKLLSGLILADSGTIHICNIQMNHANITSILNKLGLVFQNPDNQFIGITPEDDIAFGLENRKVPSHIIAVIIKEISEFLKLTDILKINAALLSGGQKQKVAIASVLANKPEIIIFDESTSMLDKKNKLEIQEIMKNLVKEEGKTVISITHDMEELLFADEIIVLKEGEIAFHGTNKELLKNYKLLIDCKLDLPFHFDLIKELKEINIPLKDFEGEDELINQLSTYSK